PADLGDVTDRTIGDRLVHVTSSCFELVLQ
ncbi:unnamed protein product, partial [marine sediment metagenome]